MKAWRVETCLEWTFIISEKTRFTELVLFVVRVSFIAFLCGVCVCRALKKFRRRPEEK
jgi:hypothetical protein